MISRRQFCVIGLAISGATASSALWLNIAFADSRPPSNINDLSAFNQLSAFLTEHNNLSPEIGQRIFKLCTNADPQFPQAVSTLWSLLQEQNISSVTAFSQSPLHLDPHHQALSQTIISAWYLGFTGTPIALRAKDDTQLVSYTGALAFAPTRDSTVIPSYSRAKTNYWFLPPSSIDTD